jgi:tetratricopeptide (TPR) repeat protein/TolB-like protein/tRNA A-37 threonylcarbamoyl transferase component Bud32
MNCARCGAPTAGGATLCPDCSSPETRSPHTRTLPLAGATAATGPTRVRGALYFEPGQAFGERYTVVEELGSGGMGQVYKALDRKLVKTVALKLIRPDTAAQREGVERFQRELALAQEVTHPNVCRVHDLGEVDGIVYISMEYVEGQSLEDLIQSVGHLSPKQTVNLGRQICAGLQAIHERGIVHRDLKPGNIMVDRSGHALVMDFGMAYHSAQERLTGEGAVLGTLAYLSPEQARSRDLDQRSDIYAVGLMLYEMLTGRRPPGDRSSVPLALRESGESCPPPSRLAPEVPGGLDALVMRCLERDPGRRFPNASALEEALAHVSASFSTGVSSRVGLLARTPSRPWPLAAALVFVAAGAAGAWWWVRDGQDDAAGPVRSPVVAVLPLANVGADPGDEYLGVGIADSLITHLASLPSVTVVSRSATLDSGRRLSGTRALARELGVTFVVNGGVQRAGDRIRVTMNLVRPDDSVAWGGEFEGTFGQFFAMQRRMSEELSAALQVTMTRAARERLARPPAASVDAYADYSRARALLERPDVSGNVARAIEGFEAALAKDPQFALAHSGLGEAYWARYQETRDPAWTAKAQGSITEALRLDPEQPRTRFALALLYQGTGRAEAALEELRRVLAQQPANDDAHRLLGDILADRGEWPEAIAELKRAVAIRPEFWRNHSSLGFTYVKTGRQAEAIAAFTKVTQLQPDNSRGFQMLGTAYQNAGDNARALENYRKAIELGPDAFAYLNMGTIYYDEGRFGEAATAYEEAVRLGPATPATYRNLGDAYERLGDAARARKAYFKAVEMSAQALQVNPTDVQALSRLAVYEAKLGRHADAASHIAQAIALSAADGDVAYRKAVVHALAGQREAALAALGEALASGYSRSRARVDYDLRTLEPLPEFQALVAQAR